MLGYFLLMALVVGGGVAWVILWADDEVGRLDISGRTFGWALILMGGLGFSLFLWQVVTVRGPVVVLTRDTWHDVRLSRHPILWCHVAGVSAGQTRDPASKYDVVIDLTEEGWASAELTRRGTHSRKRNEAYGQTGLRVLAQGLELRRDELLAAMTERLPCPAGQSGGGDRRDPAPSQ